MFPKQAVGSVVGIGGMFGAIGGMVISPLVGYILANDRQLRADLYHRGIGVSDRVADNPPARSETRASKYRSLGNHVQS